MDAIHSPGEGSPVPASFARSARSISRSYPRQPELSAYRRGRHEQQRAPLATTLGWFSIALGVTQLLAPRALSSTSGLEARPMTMRLLGTREILSGIGILNRAGRPGWLWSRVAGDAMDLTLLSMAARGAGRAQRGRIAMSTAAVAGMTALDVFASVRQSRTVQERGDLLTLEKSIIINRPADVVYQFWHNPENFPRFVRHLDSVTPIGGNRSQLRAHGPFGRKFALNVEMTIDEPGKMLAWRSLDVAGYAGSVRFESTAGGRATIVHVDIDYPASSGRFAAFAARLFGVAPQTHIDGDLRRVKQLLENRIKVVLKP